MMDRWYIFIAGAICGTCIMFLLALDAIDEAFAEHAKGGRDG